jgi:hypothetical protein
MTNQELFSQAIADAKAVRDAAVANAKAAIEETFTPKIMSMLSSKLNELEEEDFEEDKVKEKDYGMKETEEKKMEKESYEEDFKKENTEVFSKEEHEEDGLEEILAQLEAEENEGKKVEKKKEVEEGVEKKEDSTMEDKKDENAEGDDEIIELTVDELKDIIRDVLKDVMDAEKESKEEDEVDDEVKADETEAEVDDEVKADETEADDDEEFINLDELLAELDKEEKPEKADDATTAVERLNNSSINIDEKKIKDHSKDLEEAISTIRFLQNELNEVNLLNAKLLYTNKIFKTKSLTEAQKVKVLKAFDKAKNVNEVKTVYNTLFESFETKIKTTIKESVGFASKAAGVAPIRPIVEGDAAVRRMQQLAGIIK